jgi:uncharacterized protein with HEPN domain
MNRDNAYVEHILGAIEQIEEYLTDTSFIKFSKNKMMVDAVARELEVIGEAAKNLSPTFKRKNPDIQFRNITDMRNFIIHEYFNVDLKTVWDTCKNDLPDLKKMLTSHFHR